MYPDIHDVKEVLYNMWLDLANRARHEGDDLLADMYLKQANALYE